ncbi:MAG: phosphate ABC transporter ATP-binding protein [Piscirickettsiaceae bacterium]|nr:MAG: phosphate ABC transporter ATP-binding protein [Piscirickettsiaceae bacterium]PCI69516.1 MAG: phosphate ABC transporter ATP-binding protein [Piscirickettsiaceae bacterium]
MKNMMDVQDLTFTYSGAPAPSLVNICLPVERNKVTALIGPSGCGKSTLLRAMNRIHDLYPGNQYEGTINLLDSDGQAYTDILTLKKEADIIRLRQRVGMIFQKPTPFPMTIFENIAYGLRLSGVKKKADLQETVERSLRDAALWNEAKDRLNDEASGLSGGQQQRLCIARAIALKPEVILFDEPTSALDPISTLAIEEMISVLREKYSICIVTHNMQQAARISDYTGFMYLGKMIEFDNTDTIFMKPSVKHTEDYISGRFG